MLRGWDCEFFNEISHIASLFSPTHAFVFICFRLFLDIGMSDNKFGAKEHKGWCYSQHVRLTVAFIL